MMPFNPILFKQIYDRNHPQDEDTAETRKSVAMYYAAQSKDDSYRRAFERNKKTMPIDSMVDYIKCQVQSLRDIVSLEEVYYDIKKYDHDNTVVWHSIFIKPELDGYGTALSTMINDFDDRYNPTNWLGRLKNKEKQSLSIHHKDNYDGEVFKPTEKSIKL